MIKALSVLLAVLALCTANVWFIKREVSRVSAIKVLNINTLIDEHKALLNRQYELGRLTNEDMMRLTADFLTALNAAMEAEGGIILISQSVLTGGNDVTDDIRQRLVR
jgi:hypothetical protein